MMERVRNFSGKARKRGFSYVKAVSTYHAHSMRYQLVAIARPGSTRDAGEDAPVPRFHFQRADVPGIVASVPASLRSAVALEANLLLEQRFSFRGLSEIRFAENIDWDFAPEGNLSWSWDLNRHQFFLTLGTAYHYTQDTDYLDKLMTLWQDWMERHPAGKGQNWASPFEVAARLRNWIWAYFLTAAAPRANAEFLRRAWTGLCEHAEFLADHLEYHWPNNHLLLEALTLYEFGIIFRRYGGERYLHRAGKTLEEQIEEQILADGVHSELCPMYHEIVGTELEVFLELCRSLQHALPTGVDERIRAMRRFSRAIRRDDGTFPLFGDSSYPDTCLRFDTGHRTGGDLAYWLRAGEEIAQPEEPPRLSLDLFAAAGYGVLRRRERTHVVFDFGPRSRCATGHHGHSDALSFEFYTAGRPWIVDSGFFYPWNEKAKTGSGWSEYFRSTSAHNALLIDGKEQFDFDDLSATQRAKARLVSYRSSADEIAACGEFEVAGYGRPVHRREVALDSSGDLTVKDLVFQGSETEARVWSLQWLFHFAADLSVEVSGANEVLAISRGGQALICEVSCVGPMPRLRLIRGQESPRQGWVAQSSAVVAPGWVLALEVETSAPYELQVRFRNFSLGANTSGAEIHFQGG